ncbi:MAG: proline dehydrogenase family protein [Gemmatimonadetes bacterium]|nr:proline dehydrogenase family protein [Gemmatimonadota bacterium]
MLRDFFIFLSDNAFARRLSLTAPGARTMSRRFVAGETIDDGLNAARDLVASGFFVSLDYLGESVRTRAEAVAAADTYITLLERIASDPDLREKVNVSLKLTQMGQDVRLSQREHEGGGGVDGVGRGGSRGGSSGVSSGGSGGGGGASGAAIAAENSASRSLWPRPPKHATPENRSDWDEEFLRGNVIRVLDVARGHDLFVRFDMEGTPHTQRTLDFFRYLWEKGYRNTGIVLQSYLRRSEHDATEANLLGARVRLCKGAYNEPEEHAFQPKAEVDRNFIDIMKRLLSDGNYPGIATHDPAMLRATREYSAGHELPPSGWEFQMLYGIARDLQNQLITEGYNLRVYVPFGEAWYPYLMRRMAERPANAMFVVNAVLRESPFRFLFGRKAH